MIGDVQHARVIVDLPKAHALSIQRDSIRWSGTLRKEADVVSELRPIRAVPTTQCARCRINQLDPCASGKSTCDDTARAGNARQIFRMIGPADEARSLNFVARCRGDFSANHFPAFRVASMNASV